MDALKVCFVGTYPPTRCGLATFTQSLMEAMTAPGTARTAGVVRVLEAPEPPVAPRSWPSGSRPTPPRATRPWP